MINEELRMKNEELGGFAAYALTGVPDCFLMGHKTFGNACGCRGFARVSGANPNS